MSVQTISKFLMGFGVAMIFYAMNMSTTVNDVYNIGLLSQQQNVLAIGGLSFLAGIILFASSRLNKTPSVEVQNESGLSDLISTRWIGFDNILGRISIFIFIAFSTFFAVGMLCSLKLFDPIDPEILYEYALLAPSLYLLRPAPASEITSQILNANAFLFVLAAFIWSVDDQGTSSKHLFFSSLSSALYASLIFFLISLGLARIMKRRSLQWY